jgi:hemoglobin
MIRRITLAFCLLAAVTLSVKAQASMNPSLANASTDADPQAKTLYARLGGYDAIAAVTDDFVGRLVADKRFTRFFAGHSTDSIKKIRMHVIDLLCESAGGPCNYIGRTMKASHQGLGITGEDWDESVKHLVATLNKFKVPKAEQDELLAVVGTLKKDIVDKP